MLFSGLKAEQQAYKRSYLKVAIKNKNMKQDIKQILIDIYNWIMKSSANPENLSLTIKGILGTIVFVAVSFGANYTFNVDALSYDITNVISQIGIVISSLITIYGLVRKIYLTIKNSSQNSSQN